MRQPIIFLRRIFNRKSRSTAIADDLSALEIEWVHRTMPVNYFSPEAEWQVVGWSIRTDPVLADSIVGGKPLSASKARSALRVPQYPDVRTMPNG